MPINDILFETWSLFQTAPKANAKASRAAVSWIPSKAHCCWKECGYL